MALRKLATAAALAAAGPAMAQQPAPVNTSPSAGLYSPAVEETGIQRRLADLTNPQPQPQVWASAEYVLWFVQTVNVPPLIQAVPASQVSVGGTVPAGAADRLFPGQRDLYFGGASGVRATLGFRCSDNWSVDANGFVLESRSVGGVAGGDGSANSLGVGRGYTVADTGMPAILYTNLPGSYSGGTRVFADTRLFGAEGNIRRDTYRLLMSDKADLIGGLKYVDLKESVTITDRLQFPSGTTLNIQDVFRTSNRFFGSHGGLAMQWDNTRWHADLTGKVGLGFVHQKVEATGSNTFAAGGVVDSEAGGLYARPYNYGTFERDKAAFMGELTVNVGYNITENVRVTLGYSILYLSSVMRAGEAIDPVLNDSRIRYIAGTTPNGTNAPSFSWDRASDFWAQGLNVGLNVRY